MAYNAGTVDIGKRFDAKYKQLPNSFGSEPFPLVKKAAGLVDGRDALELGVGNGRNAIYLLKQGFCVTGVDASKEGLRILSEHLGKDVNAELVNSDVLTFTTTKKYDLILAVGLLHFLKDDKAELLVERMKEWTRSRGINVLAVRMTQNPKNDLPHVFAPGELRAMYEDESWEILDYSEKELPEKKIASILARKK